MNLTMDPELFSITQSKQMGTWPPGDCASFIIIPYMKRLKADSIKILEVGCMKGENAVYMLENDTTNKIELIDLVKSGGKPEFDSVLAENINGINKISLVNDPKEDYYDVVCIHSGSKNLDKTMRKYFSRLKTNGTFCGNDHPSPKVS